MWWYAFNSSTYKVEVGEYRVQDHPQLYKHCESSLAYMSPSQKPKYNKKKKGYISTTLKQKFTIILLRKKKSISNPKAEKKSSHLQSIHNCFHRNLSSCLPPPSLLPSLPLFHLRQKNLLPKTKHYRWK